MSHTTAIKRRCFLAALAAVALLSASGCQLFTPPFRRNPKLRLLRSGQGASHDTTWSSFIRPNVSPDGKQLYFLSAHFPCNISNHFGTLWRMGLNDTAALQLLPDTFRSMALSPDGPTLVLGTYGYGPIRRLLTIDLSTWTVDTIPYEQDINAMDVEFSRTVPGRVYYSDLKSGLHRIDIDGSDNVLVDSTIRGYFDLTPSDSVVLGAISKPKVRPGGRYVASVILSNDCGIILIDLTTRDTAYINARPYDQSDLAFPCWTPDGKTLIFAAAEIHEGDVTWTGPGELWVLDDVFKK